MYCMALIIVAEAFGRSAHSHFDVSAAQVPVLPSQLDQIGSLALSLSSGAAGDGM